MRPAPLLDIRDLCKRYGRRAALDGVTFATEPGSIVALLGPNGAGKTTLFKCILGVTGYSGSVEVAGVSVAAHGKQVRRRIGYLPQAPVFNDRDTCRQALDFLAELRNAPEGQARDLLQRVGLEENAGDRVGELSGGMRQRLALAAALLSDPDLLLLDEPTANLDLQSRETLEALMQELRAEGKTILVSTHFVEGIDRLADHVLVLNAGIAVLQGPTSHLLEQSRDRHYSVHLNGAGPAALLEALDAAGIGHDRVTPQDHRLADIVAQVLSTPATTGDQR